VQRKKILFPQSNETGRVEIGVNQSRRKRVKDMLDRLVHLQETDERIVAFQVEEERIPLEVREKELDIAEMEKRRDQIRASLEDLEEKDSSVKRELEEVKEQQRRSQARGLVVKTQREYQAVQREGEIARKRRGELEGQIREIQEERTILEESYLETEALFEELTKALEGKKLDADERLRKIQDEKEDLQKTRDVEASLIEPELLAKYQRVFNRYKGKGVVRVSGGVCNGCFMTIPPQLYNQVLAHGGIHNCPNCGRIIYVDVA
jgi:predicted  nucleic acid-binding Zn-ribbon protein